MDATEIGSTGLLNYHLKVLSSLIAKNESGQYLLTEKGKLASRLLMEFPEADYLRTKTEKATEILDRNRSNPSSLLDCSLNTLPDKIP